MPLASKLCTPPAMQQPPLRHPLPCASNQPAPAHTATLACAACIKMDGLLAPHAAAGKELKRMWMCKYNNGQVAASSRHHIFRIPYTKLRLSTHPLLLLPCGPRVSRRGQMSAASATCCWVPLCWAGKEPRQLPPPSIPSVLYGRHSYPRARTQGNYWWPARTQVHTLTHAHSQ